MPTFDFTSPEGKKYTVEGPAGATQEQAFQILQSQLGGSSVAKTIANDAISMGAKNFANDMGVMEQLNAGAGKMFSDLGQGISQYFPGGATRADVAETRKLDAPLMNTVAGKVGNIGAGVAMLAPSALIPGAGTVAGAGVIGGVVGALQPSESTGEALLNTAMGAAGGAGGQAIANKAAGSASFQQANNLKAATQLSQKAGAAREASAAGYVIPPEDLGGGVTTKLLSGLGGKIKTAQVASERNQSVTNNLAKQALGIAEDRPISGEALAAIRSEAGKAYDVVKGSGTVAADKAYVKALDDIASQFTTASRDFPGAVKSEIPDLVTALKQPSFSADGAVEMTKILRAKADAAFAKGDKGEGKAIKEAADVIEGMLERHLTASGMPDALKAFQDARKTIAQTYTVRKALNSATGDVSAKVLATLAEKGKPLSGGLETIAQAGQAFPKATQMLKEAPKTLSPLDVAWAAMNGPIMGAASLGARPAARSALLSGPVQRNMLANAGKPQEVNALLRALGNEDLMVPLGITGGLAGSNALMNR